MESCSWALLAEAKHKFLRNLRAALDVTTGITHKDVRLNPKAIRAQEMYGEMDIASGEWTTGVFAAIWAKFNNRATHTILGSSTTGP